MDEQTLQAGFDRLTEAFGDDPFNLDKLHPCLKPWLCENEAFGGIGLKHPWVFQPFSPMWKTANETFRRKSEAIRKAWRAKDWSHVLILHERPYRMSLLHKLYETERMSRDEMREILLHFWTDTEHPQHNQDDPMYLFREAGFTTDDQEAWEKQPEMLTLYRGVDGVCELTHDGPSWTLDRGVAKFFAIRFAKGHLYTVTVPKSEALAYIVDRGEAEIILDFENVSDPDLIELDEDFTES